MVCVRNFFSRQHSLTPNNPRTYLADFINLQLEKSYWTAFRYKPTRVLRVR